MVDDGKLWALSWQNRQTLDFLGKGRSACTRSTSLKAESHFGVLGATAGCNETMW